MESEEAIDLKKTFKKERQTYGKELLYSKERQAEEKTDETDMKDRWDKHTYDRGRRVEWDRQESQITDSQNIEILPTNGTDKQTNCKSEIPEIPGRGGGGQKRRFF